MKNLFRGLTPLVVLLSVVMVLSGCQKKEAGLPQAELNKTAPMFSLLDTDGNRVDLAAMRGKVVFVNFWATWCPPCREEMPSMLRLNERMSGKPFVMLTILMNDEPANAKAFYNNIGGALPTLLDPDGVAAKAYGITGVPETYIIDKQGILRKKFIGGWPWDSNEAMQLVGQYL